MPTEQNVSIRNGSVSFRVLQAGKGQPLVYFQSVFDREAWSPFLEALSKHYHVYVPLLPGAQGSSGIEAIDDVIDLTLAHDELLSALGLDQVNLVGHSLGGGMAAELASIFPPRSRRLVLMAPYGLWRDELPSPDVLILPPEDLAEALWLDQGSTAAKAWATLPAEETARLTVQLDNIQRRSAASKFFWPLPDTGIGKRLHRVAAPTLVLWGDKDNANPAAYAEIWKDLLPSARVRMLSGGHMLLHEAPSDTAEVVREFLDERANV